MPLVALALPSAGGDVVVLTGGKSGGHVFPALAVAEELERHGHRLVWIGAPQSMEERLVAARGIDFHALPAAPLVGRGAWARLHALWLLASSSVRAWRLLRRLGAAAVLGTGGFVSAPTVLGAWLARVPVVLVEPNARAGVANRWLSRFASLAAVAHEQTAEELRCPSVLTGVPVRAAFAETERRERGARLRLLVLGGSQGARALNHAIVDALASLRETAALVVHQTGATNLEDVESRYAAVFERCGERTWRAGDVEVRLVAFIDDMGAALREADLVVSRAGAVTLAELCAAGRGAVLVPLELAGGHQRSNAEALAAAGAARVVSASGDELAAVLAELTSRRDAVEEMGRRARGLARPGASRAIAREIDRLVEERRR